MKKPLLFRAGKDASAVSENVEILTGQRGNGLDRAITARDLQVLDLAVIRQGTGGKYQVKPNENIGSGSDGPPPAFPTQPKKFKATSGFGSVLLEWDMPIYRGHSLTEIYRSPEDNIADAVLVSTSAAGVCGDPVDPGWKGFYWIRFVNSAGVKGPFNSDDGTPAETKPDIDEILNVINKEINDSPLIGKLTSNVTAINEYGSDAYKAMWGTKLNVDGVKAGIGIVAGKDESGKDISQVAVSASQFFVFDPNKPDKNGTYSTPFAIDNGQVVITEAVIRKATIKILEAQTITADYVKAGVEIVTPTLKSAYIQNGNFSVDPNGNLNVANRVMINSSGQITIRNGWGNTGLVITNEHISVYDQFGTLRVRMGLLS